MAAVNDPRGAVGGPCRLYLVTPPEIDIRSFGDDLSRALDGGDVACVQLRLKNATDIQEFYLGMKDQGVRGRRRWKQRKTWR